MKIKQVEAGGWRARSTTSMIRDRKTFFSTKTRSLSVYSDREPSIGKIAEREEDFNQGPEDFKSSAYTARQRGRIYFVPEFDDEPDVFAPLVFFCGADFFADAALEGAAVESYNKQRDQELISSNIINNLSTNR